MYNGRHPTTLHGVKLDKLDKANIKDGKSNGEQSEEIKRVAMNTIPNVVIMCIVHTVCA